MKHVALITEYGNINIGNKLQNYAVKVLCEKNNMSPVTFEYKSKYGKLTFLERFIAAIGVPISHAQKYQMMIERTKKFKEFSNTYLGEIVKVQMQKISEKTIEDFDLFLVGSDQVWHAASLERLNYFFLKFAPKEKRGCISPSFGTDCIRADLRQFYRDGLLGFDRLCCREEKGCEIIKELTGKEAIHISDPTLLIEKKYWDNLAEKPQTLPLSGYILVYILGYSDSEINMTISAYAKEHELEVVKIYSFDNPEYYDVTPNEFIYLIQNAEIVMTDSFHGIVFSIIYGKRFIAFDRKVSNGKVLVSSRVESLLNTFGLKKNQSDTICSNGHEYDYIRIQEIIENERNKGEEWFRQYC